MSEIKGQLLGIILTLMVFGGLSATIAAVYSKTASKVEDYAKDVEVLAADEVAYEIPNDNSSVGNVSGAFPGLSY